MKNASATISGSSSALCTRKLCFVTARQMPFMSASWKASVPIWLMGTWPVMHTIGTPSMLAVARPVMVFVAPGPDVTRHTPGLPVARA